MPLMFNHFLAIVLFGFLASCTTLPQYANSPKLYSSAFSHPEQTALGSHAIDAAKPHHDLSGFYVLNNGLDGFYARAQLIDKAQASLDLQYFIFRQDETGKLLTERLIRAADRGVNIRILVDDGNTVDGDEQLLTLAAHPHIQIRIFNPLRYRGHDKFVRLAEMTAHKSHLDYRMHNKLFVADNAVALIGGRNIGDEYFQVDPKSQFGDDDVFTIGPVVKQLSQSFDEYWNSDHAVPAQNIDPKLALVDAFNRFKIQLVSYRENQEKQKDAVVNRVYSGSKLNSLVTNPTGVTWAGAQLVYDSPDKKDVEDDHLAGSLIYKSVEEAVKSTRSELLVVTPFFIPGSEGMKLFEDLRDRQVSIRVLTNSLESTPQPPAHAGYIHYRRPLLNMGVKLYEIRALLGNARGSGESSKLTQYGHYGLHAKQYVFDRQRIFLGSMNFDQRSMHLNTEIGLIIHSPELAKQEVERFERLTDPSNSYEVLLKADPATKAESLVWSTKENGKPIEYSNEPSRNTQQRIQEDLMTILPLDDEL